MVKAIFIFLLVVFRYFIGYIFATFLSNNFNILTNREKDIMLFTAFYLTIGMFIKNIVALFLKTETYEMETFKKLKSEYKGKTK